MARILIVEAPYYEEIIEELATGAVEVIEEEGHSYDRLIVSGAFELPAAIAQVARSKKGEKYDGFIALGCVIRGETTHYDYICHESARGLQDLALEGLAVGYGILTVENMEQAIVRADREQKNKGAEAARACLKMMEVKELFPAP